MHRWIHQFGRAGVGSFINYFLLSCCSLIIYRARSSSQPACRYLCSLIREADTSDPLPVWSCFEDENIPLVYSNVCTTFCCDKSKMNLPLGFPTARKKESIFKKDFFKRICPCWPWRLFWGSSLHLRKKVPWGNAHKRISALAEVIAQPPSTTTKLIIFHIPNSLAGVSSTSGGQLLVSVGSLLDDQHWHHVKLESLSTHLNLTVDKNTHQVHIPAELSHWDIHQVRETFQHTNTHGLKWHSIYGIWQLWTAWVHVGCKTEHIGANWVYE